jgi:hypothetical protein
MRIDAAREYVETHGNPIERASLAYLIDRKIPLGSAIDEVLRGQSSDGAWAPFWAPDYGSLDATCYRLAQARTMGVGQGDARICRALRFISGNQRKDGGWEEEPRVADVALPWVAPGEL